MPQQCNSRPARRQRPTRRERNEEKQKRPQSFEFDSGVTEALCAGQISKTGHLICNLILRYTSMGRAFWMGNAAMAEALNVSPKTIANELSALRRCGQVTDMKKAGWRYLEVAPARFKRQSPPQKDGAAALENANSNGGAIPESRDHRRHISHVLVLHDCTVLEDAGIVVQAPVRNTEGESCSVGQRPQNSVPPVPFRMTGSASERRRAYRSLLRQTQVRGFPLKRLFEKRNYNSNPRYSHNSTGKTQMSPRNTQPGAVKFPPHRLDEKPRCEVEPWDRTVWARIREFVVRQRKPVTRNSRLQGEAVAIARRRLAKIGVTREEMEKVWAWYASNYGRPGVKLPLILNAAQLYDQWVWVTDRMKKAEEADAPPPPEVANVLGRLENLHWPKGAGDKLPAVAKQSFANLRSFLRKLESTEIPGRRGEIDVVADLIRDPEDYLYQWFKSFHKRVSQWGGWSGDMGSAVWRPDAAAFAREASGAMARYGGDGSVWWEIYGKLGGI